MDIHHQHAKIYSSTPKLVEPFLSSPRPTTDRNDFISSLVHSLVQSDTIKQSTLIESLRHQQQIIGTNSKNIHQFSKQKRKHLSRKGNKLLTKTIKKVRHDARQLRSTTEQQLKTDYNNYIFMNDLWKQYIAELLKDATSNDAILQRIVTADYHGALIRVVEAKNQSLVGKEGIVIQETKTMFIIVEKIKDRRCSILKKDCLFSMDISIRDEKQTVFVSGTAISVRPEQRGQKRSTSIEHMREFC
jgi:ribonuclease P protein subunit POP4